MSKKLNMIIIEVEEAHFKLMERAIVKNLPHASVSYFKDASACLEKLDEITPDIIITDYLMPGMNGIEFLEALNRSNKQIPVIMTTGQGDEDIAVQAMKLGAWDYLVKSADFFTLLPSVIEKVIREFKLKELLHKSEKRFQDLAERTSDWIWEVDIKGKYTYSNPLVKNITGCPPDEVIGKYFYDFFADEFKKTLKQNIFQIMKEERAIRSVETHLKYKNGSKVIVERSGIPIFGKAGELIGYRGIDRDITIRKKAENKVRILSQQLMRAQEIERQKLSCDLHDHLAQELSTLKLGIDTLFDNQIEVPVTIKQKVADLSDMAHKIIADIRDMAYFLRPDALDNLGLVRAILQYCDNFSAKNNIKVDFLSAGMDDSKLNFDTNTAIYRLIQEGLNNVKKHADALQATIRLIASYPDIILLIEDNGKGFDVKRRLISAQDEKRMGLLSMEQRVASLSGKMKVLSRLMHGTKISIEIPMETNSE
ncbi:MAG: response regulator [Desulfobacterales bacterium]|nr:response regulator [Desulfobacterales bacterium]